MENESGRMVLTSNGKIALQVVFVDEEGDDAGGVKKEFFMLLFQELLQPK